MASRPNTPYDIFGPSPFEGEQLLAPSLGSELMPEASINALAQPTLDLAASVPQTPPQDDLDVIRKLKPGSDLHAKVLQKLDAMLKFSADEMQKHYDRWNIMERKVQAFLHNQDYSELVEGLKDNVLPPEPVQVVVPYTYATQHAAATYISSVLLGRKPVFGLNATRGTEVDAAQNMEHTLQHNLDYSMGSETLWQGIWDSLCYSFNVTGIGWENKTGPVMRIQNGQRLFEDGTIYAGNKLTALDPYNCFPDPRVPIHKCADQGDFFFARREQSKTVLYDMERNGLLMWTKAACEKAMRSGRPSGDTEFVSQRRLRIGVDRASSLLMPKDVVGFVPVMEGTVRLVPKEWGLGDKETSELWKFIWTRTGQIMYAQPLGMLHAKHPIAAAEPTSLGHDFMSLSQAEMIGVFQDVLSWLVSSRMENVRSAINNMFVADPSRVEVNDIMRVQFGKVIRMKKSAMGLPIDEAIKHLSVTDVTGGHLQDLQMMRMLADSTTGVNDNLRGIQTQGGRRSATEARMSMQAGASRLSQMAIRTSSQAYLPMAQQMILNVQQYMPEEIWIEMTGDVGMESKRITPEMLAGSFNYQVTDGSLPLDKGALVETWKEILFGIARDPELRQRFDLGKIFKYTAELGGAKNIDSFERQLPQIAPPGADPAEQGGVPVGPAVPQMPNIGAFA